jgi:hypothetical protein
MRKRKERKKQKGQTKQSRCECEKAPTRQLQQDVPGGSTGSQAAGGALRKTAANLREGGREAVYSISWLGLDCAV